MARCGAKRHPTCLGSDKFKFRVNPGSEKVGFSNNGTIAMFGVVLYRSQPFEPDYGVKNTVEITGALILVLQSNYGGSLLELFVTFQANLCKSYKSCELPLTTLKGCIIMR